MNNNYEFKVNNILFGDKHPLVLIAGPCVIESEDEAPRCPNCISPVAPISDEDLEDFKIDEEHISLKEGDALYFHGHLPHRWVNNSKKISEILFVFTPPFW